MLTIVRRSISASVSSPSHTISGQLPGLAPGCHTPLTEGEDEPATEARPAAPAEGASGATSGDAAAEGDGAARVSADALLRLRKAEDALRAEGVVVRHGPLSPSRVLDLLRGART